MNGTQEQQVDAAVAVVERLSAEQIRDQLVMTMAREETLRVLLRAARARERLTKQGAGA